MRRSAITPDEFIASLPDDVRADVADLDRDIASIMAGRERVLWEGAMWGGTQQSIIGYGAYQAVNRSGEAVDWFLVGLARQTRHLSIYVNAVEDGAYLPHAFATRLGKVRLGSASIAFRRLEDLDRQVLREMIARALELVPDVR